MARMFIMSKQTILLSYYSRLLSLKRMSILLKNNKVYQFLKQFRIFKDLNEFEMEPIIDIATLRDYENESIIFMQDEPITNVYFILKGKIKIYKTDYHGKEQIINVLQDGDMFPHQGFFRKGSYPAHAEVVGSASLVNIPIQSFENFLITHPEISIKMFRVLGELIIDLQNRLEERNLYNVYDQVILLLMRLARKNGEQLNDTDYRITLSLTNRELANMIGSSRETVSRTLSQLKKEQFVKTDEAGYLVINYVALENEVLK